MKLCNVAFACVFLWFSPIVGNAVFHEATGEVVENQYIVVLNEDVTMEQKQHSFWEIFETSNKVLDEPPKIEKDLSIGDTFKAYLVTMNNSTLRQVLQLPHVCYVTPNEILQLRNLKKTHGSHLRNNESNNRPTNPESCLTQTGADWGLERTCEKYFTNNGKYTYSAQYQGQGVDAYVIDSGLYPNNDFEGRAKFVKDFVYNNVNKPDTAGHGTLVASLIIGKKYGIAKKANVGAIRIVGKANDSASTKTIVESIQWVVAEAKRKKRTVVLNMSIGVKHNAVIDNAANAAIREGVALIVPAGNDGRDACLESPASVKAAITVAGSDKQDRFWVSPFDASNYGSCVDIFAPSENILGAGISSPTSTSTQSGTSFGAPLVAGIVAKLLSQDPHKTPAQLKSDVIAMATDGILKPNGKWPSGTANRLVYMGCS